MSISVDATKIKLYIDEDASASFISLKTRAAEIEIDSDVLVGSITNRNLVDVKCRLIVSILGVTDASMQDVIIKGNDCIPLPAIRIPHLLPDESTKLFAEAFNDRYLTVMLKTADNLDVAVQQIAVKLVHPSYLLIAQRSKSGVIRSADKEIAHRAGEIPPVPLESNWRSFFQLFPQGTRDSLNEQNKDTLRAQINDRVRALFDILKERLDFAGSTFLKLENDWLFQKVHGPADTLKILNDSADNRAEINCLDGAIFFANVLKQWNVSPLIYIAGNHAVVGWKYDRDVKIDKTNCIDFGHTVNVLDTTKIHDSTFDDAQLSARIHLEGASARFFADVQTLGEYTSVIDVEAVLQRPWRGSHKILDPLASYQKWLDLLRQLGYISQNVSKPLLAETLEGDIVDVGTVWGLTRSAFTAIAIDSGDSPLIEILRNTEYTLLESLTGSFKDSGGFPTALPTRIWLRVDPTQIHQTSEEALQTLPAHERLLLNEFRDDTRLMEQSLRGLVISVDDEYSQPSRLDAVASTVKRLIEKDALSVVIHVKCESIARARQSAETILKAFQMDNIPIEQLFLRTLRNTPIFTTSEATTDEEAFLAWLGKMISEGASGSILDDNFQGQLAAADRAFCGTPTQIAHFLEQQPPRTVSAFLILVSEYLSSALVQLVSALAQSGEFWVRRQSLLAAVRDSLFQDDLIDAWITHNPHLLSDLSVNSGMLFPDEHNAIIDIVLISALRCYRQNSRNTLFERVLSAFKPSIISPELISLRDTLIQGKKRNNNADVKLLEIGLSVGIDNANSLFDDRIPHDTAKFWQIARRCPVGKDSVRGLLALPTHDRAILGLCSQQEWNSLEKHIQQQTMEWRRKQPLNLI